MNTTNINEWGGKKPWIPYAQDEHPLVDTHRSAHMVAFPVTETAQI